MVETFVLSQINTDRRTYFSKLTFKNLIALASCEFIGDESRSRGLRCYRGNRSNQYVDQQSLR